MEAAKTQPDWNDPLCISTGEGGVCGTTRSLMAGQLTLFAGPELRGLVPDGVATVRLRYANGAVLTAAVQDNLALGHWPATTLSVISRRMIQGMKSVTAVRPMYGVLAELSTARPWCQ